MGKSIEKLGASKDFIIHTIIKEKEELFSKKDRILDCDVAIEFTNPQSAFENVKFCLENSIPIVSGTTAWNEHLKKAKELSKSLQVSFFHASNFSLGVHHFFQLNKMLAKGLNGLDYKIEIEEIHHTEKIDSPSGTAISLAEIVSGVQDQYEGWTEDSNEKDLIKITSKRIQEVKGTHMIRFTSEIDEICISHKAFTREGFATGALLAAKFITENTGCFSMEDLIKNNS